ncbi:MAG: class II aldolase/adducin family protein [Phycisphaeraceae bacterium]|nr:class II aldolase/adducin family protein [Phycisphaeraceae bacterium]
MNVPLWQMKKLMADIGHKIWIKGFCAGNEGNHSLRLDDHRVLCTPTGISKGFLDPDDMCIVDMEGKQIEQNPRGRKRTSEVLVHLAIYKKRPDVKAVIHSHPPHATAFCIAGIPLPSGIHPEAEVFLGKVPTAPYATPSKQELPDSITPLIGPETNTVLMGNHGSVTFSTDLVDCYYKLEILDAYCRILLLSKQVGHINELSPSQMTELLQVKQKFGMKDPRLACASTGCVTEDNQPFLATFDDRPATASCDCDGGPVTAASVPSGNLDNAAFEQMVQAITDQIMAARK